MKRSKGQAFDTFKLMIAAVVAVAILGILLSILGGINNDNKDWKTSPPPFYECDSDFFCLEEDGFASSLKEFYFVYKLSHLDGEVGNDCVIPFDKYMSGELKHYYYCEFNQTNEFTKKECARVVGIPLCSEIEVLK